MSQINTVGWLKLWRQIVMSDVWSENDPYDSRSAFLFILSQAWFTPGYYKGNKVERGQFPTSEEELSNIFKWSRGKVHRFLEALSEKKTISFDYKADRHTTLITITNYEHFQEEKKQAADRQWTGYRQDTDRRRTGNEQQYKKEEGKKKEEESLSPASAGPPPAGMSEPSRGTPEWYKLHYDD